MPQDPENARLLAHARRAAGVLGALLAAGTLGYCAIEGWRWLDALYMTVITLTTIGFGETHPLSDAGRVFTIALIFVGAGNLAYALGGMTQFFASGGLDAWRRRTRMTHTLETISGHTIVCGCGRLGGAVAGALVRQGAQVVVVDRSAHALARFVSDAPAAAFVEGDASEDDILKRAGIERARALVAALNDDASNVFLTLTARVLKADLAIYGKADDPSTLLKLERAGANVQFSPALVAGQRIAHQILRPRLTEVVAFSAGAEADDLGIEEVTLEQLRRPAGAPLGETPVWGRPELMVLGVRRGDGTMLFPPTRNHRLASGERVLVMGRLADLGAALGADVLTQG